MLTTKGGKELKKAGFHVIKEIGIGDSLWGFKKGRWFAVVSPENEGGIVLMQGPNIWHFFAKNTETTASGSSAKMCHYGGLGDAIDTDSQIASYKRYLLNAPDSLIDSYDGLYRASSDAYNS